MSSPNDFAAKADARLRKAAQDLESLPALPAGEERIIGHQAMHISEAAESPIERLLGKAMLQQWTRPGTTTRVLISAGVEYEPPGDMPANWLTDGQLWAISPQQPVGVYRADFAIWRWVPEIHWRDREATDGFDYVRRLGPVYIECDGHDFHERTKVQASRDRGRDRWFAANKLTVLRFTGSEIWRDPIACVKEIEDVFDALERDPGTPQLEADDLRAFAELFTAAHPVTQDRIRKLQQMFPELAGEEGGPSR